NVQVEHFHVRQRAASGNLDFQLQFFGRDLRATDAAQRPDPGTAPCAPGRARRQLAGQQRGASELSARSFVQHGLLHRPTGFCAPRVRESLASEKNCSTREEIWKEEAMCAIFIPPKPRSTMQTPEANLRKEPCGSETPERCPAEDRIGAVESVR